MKKQIIFVFITDLITKEKMFAWLKKPKPGFCLPRPKPPALKQAELYDLYALMLLNDAVEAMQFVGRKETYGRFDDADKRKNRYFFK